MPRIRYRRDLSKITRKYIKRKRFINITIAIAIVILTVLTFQFKSVLNCVAVDNSNFIRVEKDIYFDPDIPTDSYKMILSNIKQAKERVAGTFGSFNAEPVIIICNGSATGKKYGLKNKTGITQKTIIGSYIVLGEDGTNVDVIAHELTHCELAGRLSGIKGLKVPIWFDDGLATQVDNRPQYSEREWLRKTENGTKLIRMSELDSPKQFYVSDLETRRLHYTLAKHELSRWLDIVHQEGLLQLIDNVNKGDDFYTVYKRIELENKPE